MIMTITLIHAHDLTGDDLIMVDATKVDAKLLDLSIDSCHDAWVAVPPTGSDWERADWEALAQRAGVL
jgi:hypothetical protein